jgi:hypothetical protein
MKWITILDIVGLILCIALTLGIFCGADMLSHYIVSDIASSNHSNVRDAAAESIYQDIDIALAAKSTDSFRVEKDEKMETCTSGIAGSTTLLCKSHHAGEKGHQ